jgi:hypothetical protein
VNRNVVERQTEVGENLSQKAFQVDQLKYGVEAAEWHHASTIMVMVEGPCSTNDDLCYQA